MDSYINKIYELLYRPVVTPYNLLENAKLANYKYVNYYKAENGLVAEMKCSMEGDENVIFFYHFDLKDNLLKVYMQKEDNIELVFDRQQEVNKLMHEYSKRNSLNKKVI